MKDPNPHRKPPSRGIPGWVVALVAAIVVLVVLYNSGSLNFHITPPG